MTRKIMRISLIVAMFSTAIIAENKSLANIEGFEEIASSEIYRMSTIELQNEVEKRTNAGKVPFEMGLELIRRWTER